MALDRRWGLNVCRGVLVCLETHRKWNSERYDILAADVSTDSEATITQYAMLSERPGIEPGRSTKNIEYRKSLC